jgi:hypothetical protein
MPIENGGDYFVTCQVENSQAKSAKVHPIVDGLVYPPLLLHDIHLHPILDEVNKLLSK